MYHFINKEKNKFILSSIITSVNIYKFYKLYKNGMEDCCLWYALCVEGNSAKIFFSNLPEGTFEKIIGMVVGYHVRQQGAGVGCMSSSRLSNLCLNS